MIRVKRAYDAASPDDGLRILADRLWPRGLGRARAAIDEWPRDLAPSDRLRRWFAHDPARWAAFRRRYRRELARHATVLARLARTAARRRITLVFAARDPRRNNAVVLKEALESCRRRSATRSGHDLRRRSGVGGPAAPGEAVKPRARRIARSRTDTSPSR